MRERLMIKKKIPWMGVCIIIGLAWLSGQAYGLDVHPEMSPIERDYWRFIEHQWTVLHEAEYLINSPRRAATLKQMNVEAMEISRRAGEQMYSVFMNLKNNPPPPALFQCYHNSFMGFVDRMWSITSCYEVIYQKIDVEFQNAYMRAGGNKSIFQKIASKELGRVVEEWRPILERYVREMGYYQQGMESALQQIDYQLGQRTNYSGYKPKVSRTEWSITFDPFFLPIKIKLSNQGVSLSFSKKINTPIGSVTVQSN
jgi:hypothetical protein